MFVKREQFNYYFSQMFQSHSRIGGSDKKNIFRQKYTYAMFQQSARNCRGKFVESEINIVRKLNVEIKRPTF